MKKLKLGIIGCGDIGTDVARIVQFNKRIEITGCADIREERAQSYAARFKIPASFSSYTNMIDSIKPDALYLAVPHNFHFPILKEIINRGLPVLCEKPVTISIEDAIEITSLAHKKEIKVGINYQYRYDKCCYTLKQAADRGDLGKIYYTRINVPWHREQSYFEKSAWHSKLASAGGGTLITQGSHALDFMLWLSSAVPQSVQGVTAKHAFTNVEVEDFAMGTVTMSDGSYIHITCSMVATPQAPMTIEVYGSKGTALYQGSDIFPKISFKGVKVRSAKPPAKGFIALMRSIEGFRQWVVDDVPYLIPIEESIPALAVVEAFYQSAKSGKTEKIDTKHRLLLTRV